MPARTPIAELEDIFEIDLDEDDVDTVYGLLTKLLGRVPIVGSSAVTRGLRLTAVDSAGAARKPPPLLSNRSPMSIRLPWNPTLIPRTRTPPRKNRIDMADQTHTKGSTLFPASLLTVPASLPSWDARMSANRR